MNIKITNLKILKCIGLSLLAFIILLAILLPAISVMPKAQADRDSDIAITDFKFVWSNDAKAIEGKINEWSISNIQNPVTKPFGMQLVRLNTTIPAHQSDMSLQIITAGNPMKALLDGKEIYNAGYEEQTYAGNRTNIIALSASEKEQPLDLFLRVPLSFELDIKMIDPANAVTVASFSSLIGTAVSIGVILTGVLIIILMGLFSVKGYSLNVAVWLGGILLLTGVGALLSQTSFFAEGFTSPWFYKTQLLSLFTASAGLSFISIHVLNGWRRNEQIVVWTQMIYALLFMILPDAIGVWLTMLSPVILLGAVLIITLRLADFVQNGAVYSGLITFAYLTASFCLLFDFINQIIGWMTPVHELSFTGVFIYCYIAFYVLVKQSIGLNIRHAERTKQIELDSKWVQRTISSCAGVFTQQKDIDFCKETANAVKDLVMFDRLCHDETNASDGKDVALSICIGLCTEHGYEEIYTENMSEECRYEKILEHSREKENEPILFGSLCVDMLLRYQEEPFCIIHVEGVTGGISLNLQNIMHIAHTNFESALSNMKLNKGINDTQINVFLNLSELAEYRSHSTGEHLKVVAEFVNVLCQELGLPENEREIVCAASMMHDIGKLAISESIIDKEGALTDEEFAAIKKHVHYGYNILSKSSGAFMEAAAVIAKEHHERYDGTGYLKMKSEDIHLYARIVMVADVFDALLSKRPYKEAWPEEDAIAHLNAQSGKHFDPKIIEAFNRCCDKMLEIKHKYDN